MGKGSATHGNALLRLYAPVPAAAAAAAASERRTAALTAAAPEGQVPQPHPQQQTGWYCGMGLGLGLGLGRLLQRQMQITRVLQRWPGWGIGPGAKGRKWAFMRVALRQLTALSVAVLATGAHERFFGPCPAGQAHFGSPAIASTGSKSLWRRLLVGCSGGGATNGVARSLLAGADGGAADPRVHRQHQDAWCRRL